MLDFIASVLTLKTILVGLVAGLMVYWITRKLKYKLPPGPFALPIIGNILQFKTVMIHEELYEWSKKYGPVMSIYFGPSLAIVVNDIDSAMEVLVKKGSDFAGRVSLPSFDAITDGGKDIALGQYGPTWKLHRKIATKALRHYMLGDKLEERLHKALSVMFHELEKEKHPFDPANYIDFAMVNILIGLCFGGNYAYDDPELNQLIKLDDEFLELLDGAVLIDDMIPGLGYVWESPKLRRLRAIAVGINDDLLAKKYWEHVHTFDKDNVRDFADTLILARQDAENDPHEADLDKLTDTHIIQTLSDIFFAGIDTSRLSLRYAILHMAAYPDIQTKVQEEIDRVVGPDQLPKVCHRPQLSYTEAVLHESMRLSSVFPSGIPHKATRNTSVGGYDVPKDTMVIINLWALHHDPRAWKNVNDFIPERFLDPQGKLGPKPESWLPFSAGRRVCLGESVAKPELHLFFAALMQKYTWRIPDGVKVDLSPTGNSTSLSPRPHKFIVEKRKPSCH